SPSRRARCSAWPTTPKAQTTITATIPASTVHRTGAVRGPDRTGAASTVARKAPQPRASRNTAVGVRTVRRREGVGTDVYTFCRVVPARDRTAGSSRRRPSTPLYPAAPAAGHAGDLGGTRRDGTRRPAARPPHGTRGAPGPQPRASRVRGRSRPVAHRLQAHCGVRPASREQEVRVVSQLQLQLDVLAEPVRAVVQQPAEIPPYPGHLRPDRDGAAGVAEQVPGQSRRAAPL